MRRGDTGTVAASRRPGFSKRQLAAGLTQAGIGYLHLPGLGLPKEGRLATRAELDEFAGLIEGGAGGFASSATSNGRSTAASGCSPRR